MDNDCPTCKKFKRSLAYIYENDKTEYDYHGRLSKNRNGERPLEGRWMSPRELAQEALIDAGTNIWEVLKDIKGGASAGN